MPKQQRIRDPLHDLVEFNVESSQVERVLWSVLQSRPFQRLRRIKQLGFSDFVYPGATHSRLLHSVGVFHTARRLLEVIEHHTGVKDARGDQALAAALVHDLGHGPFSHAFERIGDRFKLKMANHEAVSDMIIRDSELTPLLCSEMGSGFANDVADMVRGSGARTIYSAVVSSQFDADRLDYMRRDRLMTGTQHAGIDFEWLVENLEIGEVSHGVGETRIGQVQTFVLGKKAIFAAEAYVLGLFQLYPTVYFHKATRAAEQLFFELLSRTIQLVKDGAIGRTALSARHPLVLFAQNSDSLESALALDDTVVWGALSLMAESPDKCIADLSGRLRDRKLYKCTDVRAVIARNKGDDAAASPEADTVCAKIQDELAACAVTLAKDDPNAPPRILLDEAERSPYRRMTEDTKGPLNQINIHTEGDRLEDLAKRSKVVAELKSYKAFRAYYREGDEVATRSITGIVERGIEEWAT